MTDEFITMTELGKLYGVSSHKIGKWLMEMGLRTSDKKPSSAAFESSYVEQRCSTQPGTYFWVWDKAKTLRALDKAGHKTVEHLQK